ncbi:hypothetical protein [Brachybacterium sp. AOP29-B2-41]|uniref:hypothetical protein n=1 Tax=Brachybacterium sp. AOP29-B2-41 TaxID=3457704 RepID=UPI004034350D
MIGGVADPVGRAQEELCRLFPGKDGLEDAVVWARDVLADAGLDPAVAPLRCVRRLRRTNRSLGLLAARYLTDAVAGRRQDRASRPLNPHLE